VIAADGGLGAIGSIGSIGSIDKAATEKLRAELVAARGTDEALFNFGGDLEDIRSRCEAETHLPAPVKPTFIGAS
jgi:N-methylhydantoinase B